MTSIYQRALGSDFQRLHPQIQRRFGFASGDRDIPFRIENYAFVDRFGRETVTRIERSSHAARVVSTRT